MQKIKRVLVALLCLVLALVVFLFTLENRQGVELGFLGHGSPQMPLAVAIMLAFILGALLSALTFWWPLLRQKSKNKRLQRKLVRLATLLEQAEDKAAAHSQAVATVTTVAD